jgi:hypothetical protein
MPVTSRVRSCGACRSTGSKYVKAGKSAIFHFKQQCKEAVLLDLPIPSTPRRIVNCQVCNGLGILDSPVSFLAEGNDDSGGNNDSGVSLCPPAFTGKICVIGGGIGGLAFALAGLQRGLDITVYEKDADFSTRSQVDSHHHLY